MELLVRNQTTTLENLTSTFLPNLLQSNEKVTFSWYDYILFSLMLAVSAIIGIYFGCFGSKQSTAKEYLMGGKKMKVFPIAMSLTASHISGITLLAVPADVFRYGAGYCLMIVSLFIVCFATMYVYLPVFFKMQITSTYEYLERRFDSKTRMFASFLFALAMFLYLPIVIYIPALAFSAATGINVHLITPIVCGVCIFYTTLGGLKAVVWTDTLQFAITLGALAAVFILGLRSVGGVQAVIKTAYQGERINLLDFDLDPTKRDSFWPVVLGLFFSWLSITSVNQGCVQKFLSVSTLKEAQLSVVYFAIGMTVVTLTSVFTGLIMFAKYADCDPFTTGTVTKNDQLLPHYVMDVAGNIPGLPGLFIAGVFCAGLSTLSAHLNCLSGTLYEDFIAKCIPSHSEKTTGYILKLLVIIIGVICTALVFVIEKFGGILPLAMSLGGLTAGPLLGMFTLGVLFPRANSKGTFYGSILALLFTGWIVFTAQYYKAQGILHYSPKPTSIDGCESYLNNFTTIVMPIMSENFTQIPPSNFSSFDKVSYYYYSMIGCCTSMIAGLVISYLTNKNDPPVHRDVLSPVIYFMLNKDEDYKENNVEYYTVDKALHIVTLNGEK